MKPNSEINEQVIAEWKKQYGSVARLTVTENGEKKVVYVRKPTNKEIDFASANLTRGAFTTYGITLFNTCKIGGDEITSEDSLRAIGAQMTELIEQVEVEFEKL